MSIECSQRILLVVVTLVLAAGLRVLYGRGLGYEADAKQFSEWADTGAEFGLAEMYTKTSINYPPLSACLFWGIGKIRSAYPVLNLERAVES